MKIGGEFVADAQGIGQGRQGMNGPRREYRAAEIGHRSGGDQQLIVGNGLAVGDDLALVEIQARGGGGKKVHAGGEQFPQGTRHDPLRDPAAGQVGQGGQHGGHGTGIHEQDVSAVPRENPAGLEACEAAAENDGFPVHDGATYRRMPGMQPIPDEFETLWRRHLETHSLWQSWKAADPVLAPVVLESLRVPGKRLRPRLFCAACRAFGRDPFPGLMPAALALELAHAFILIHDDLIDGSEHRRGAASLPRRLDDAMGGSRGGNFRGSDAALVAGDVLYSLAMESLTQAEAPPERLLAASREFMRAALDTGRGALLEIRAARTPPDELSLDDVEEMYALKTGAYTFRLPVRLAAVLAGTGDDLSLDDFSRPAGIAFQLSNDRQGLGEWLAGGPLPDDLRDGRPIWAVVWARRAADAGAQRLFVPPPGPAFRDWFRTCGAMEALDRAIQEHADAARDRLPDPALRDELDAAIPS